MTKEDVSEPVEGDVVLGCRSRLSSHHRPVIHQVASAPMPSDCGEEPIQSHRCDIAYHKLCDWNLKSLMIYGG